MNFTKKVVALSLFVSRVDLCFVADAFHPVLPATSVARRFASARGLTHLGGPLPAVSDEDEQTSDNNDDDDDDTSTRDDVSSSAESVQSVEKVTVSTEDDVKRVLHQAVQEGAAVNAALYNGGDDEDVNMMDPNLIHDALRRMKELAPKTTPQSSMEGDWKLVLVSQDDAMAQPTDDDDDSAIGNTVHYLPSIIKVTQSFELNQTTNITGQFEQELTFGKKEVSFSKLSGTFEYEAYRKSGDQVDLTFDRVSILGRDIPSLGLLSPSTLEEQEEADQTTTTNESEAGGDEATEEGEEPKKKWFGWIRKAARKAVSWTKKKVTGLENEYIQKGSMGGTWKATFLSRKKGKTGIMGKVVKELFKMSSQAYETSVRMEQRIDLMTYPAGIQWDVIIGEYIMVRLMGRADLGVNDQFLLDSINLEFDSVKVLGTEIDLVAETAAESFQWIRVDDALAISANSGSLYLWERID